MNLLESSIIAFVTTLFCIWLLKPLAIHIGLVDRPSGRKIHQFEVPLVGGVAMFIGFCFALLTLHISLQPYRGLLAGSGILVLMGVVDDFNELGSKLRLLGQLLACLLLVIWGQELVSILGNLFFLGDIKIGQWALPFTVLAVMSFINAMNMLDGQDGLAGSVALGQVMLFLFLSIYLQRHIDVLFLAIIAVLLVVFLAFNLRLPKRQHAIIFMGDAGSTFVAYMIAWFGVNLSQANVNIVNPITIVWVLAFPLFDLFSVLVYRIRHRQSPFRASRDHIHHILQLHGMNASLSTFILTLFSVFLGGIGIAMNFVGLAEGWQLLTMLLFLTIYLFFVRIIRNKKSNV